MDELIPYVTDATFDAEVMRAPLPVLVCFGTTNIFDTYRTLMPVLDEISKEYAGRVNVVKLNADENQQTWKKFNISGFPSLSLFINGNIEETKTHLGKISRLQLSAFIDVLIKIKKDGLGEQRKRFELWLLNRINRSDEAESIKKILLIADACDAAIARGKLSDEQLHIIVDGGSSAYAMQWDPTMALIVVMHKKGVDVTPVLRELFKSKKASARSVALRCIKKGAISLPITDEILTAALADKSAGVRGQAGVVASCTFKKLWLLPLLEQIVKKYPEMEFYIKLLRDDYALTRLQDGRYEMGFASIQGALILNWINSSEYEIMKTKGVDVVMAESIKRFNDSILSDPWSKRLARQIPVEEHRTVYAA